ncbi:uncharacterized protein APUU_41280A [Aspergillus puulaauensis]|uniref:Uncharacterized protein n=1 Tax=Aspergillus puulaauensis TaxID=1220207 RepID=A0A7R8AMX9_9EURO|nr:uncharacterized protein APUU_41280A [Aspergillus puulaauensis]BCS24836.1 hypothetical protein APUU_41280A [Aspergillus puulaauensis]
MTGLIDPGLPWRHLRSQRNPSLARPPTPGRRLGKCLRAPGAMSQSETASPRRQPIKFLINLKTRLGSLAHVSGDGRKEEKTTRPSSIRSTNSEGPKLLTGQPIGIQDSDMPVRTIHHSPTFPALEHILKSIPHNPNSARDSNSTHEQLDDLDRNTLCSP